MGLSHAIYLHINNRIVRNGKTKRVNFSSFVTVINLFTWICFFFRVLILYDLMTIYSIKFYFDILLWFKHSKDVELILYFEIFLIPFEASHFCRLHIIVLIHNCVVWIRTYDFDSQAHHLPYKYFRNFNNKTVLSLLFAIIFFISNKNRNCRIFFYFVQYNISATKSSYSFNRIIFVKIAWISRQFRPIIWWQ